MRTTSGLTARYLQGRRHAIALQTLMETRYGAIRAQWGSHRLATLDHALGSVRVLPADIETATITAELRYACLTAGHPLH
ncbi:MAG: hypothetical protein ACRC35_01380 [Angustibacter sp.]